MFNQTVNSNKKHICYYYFQSFSTAQILERHVNDCIEISDKQMIKMVTKGETVVFKKNPKTNKNTIHNLYSF